MPKIIKNGKEYSGVPIEVVTAWAPTADPVQVKEPLMGNTDISAIGDGTVTGAIDTLNDGLTDINSKIPSDIGWTDIYGDNCKAMIRNGIVFVRGVSIGNTSIGGGSNYVTLTTLPQKFRPPGTYYFPAGWSGSVLNMRINSAGEIAFAGNATTYWNYFVSYPATI